MAAHLLRTKLFVSPVRAKLVPRPGLIERLDFALQKKLTLISAPAGYGKTTLLQSWIQDRNLKTAWFSIDERDNDLVRFWSYCVAALQTVQPDLGGSILAALRSVPQAQIESLLEELINEFAPDQHLIFVLDDYHLISRPEIHDSLQFFLFNAPPQVHLILATRSDPPWPLARTRSCQDLLELRADDLRFTHDESEYLLNQIMGFNLAPESVQKIKNRTEGWVAGLQMAALSMQNHTNLEHLIENFSATNCHIFDYLVEEILSNQPQEVKEFLIKTSVLNRMSAPLCDSVLEISNSAEILEYLNQENIFINPLDHQRQWYSYHRLFRDLLQIQLRPDYIDLIPGLQRRASQWFADQRQFNEAIHYAMQANDYDQFAAITKKNAMEMIQQLELTALKKWIDELTVQEIFSKPWLAVAYAWVQVNICHLPRLDEWLDQIEENLQGRDDQDRDHLLGHVYAIRHYYHGQHWDNCLAKKYSEMALNHLPEDDSTRAWISSTNGTISRKIGDLESAEHAFLKAIGFYEDTTNIEALLYSQVGLANTYLARGKLKLAEQSYREILALARQGENQDSWYPISGYVQSVLSSIHMEWNQLESAFELAREGVQMSERWGQGDFLSYSYVQYIYALLALGRFGEARTQIQKIDKFLSIIPEWPRKLMTSFKFRIFINLGDVETAKKIAKQSQIHSNDSIEFLHVLIYINYARVLIATGEFLEAISLLERLHEICQSAGAVDYLIEILICLAVAYQKSQQFKSAQTALKLAIDLAEPEGYLRKFFWDDPEFHELLVEVISQMEDSTYARSVLSSYHEEFSSKNGHTPVEFVEPLTPREFEVLQLLTTTQSVPEIADQMVVSVNTVRTHVQHIYDKLGVNRRRNAVQKAKILELV